jgi:hypothetical protein
MEHSNKSNTPIKTYLYMFSVDQKQKISSGIKKGNHIDAKYLAVYDYCGHIYTASNKNMIKWKSYGWQRANMYNYTNPDKHYLTFGTGISRFYYATKHNNNVCISKIDSNEKNMIKYDNVSCIEFGIEGNLAIISPDTITIIDAVNSKEIHKFSMENQISKIKTFNKNYIIVEMSDGECHVPNYSNGKKIWQIPDNYKFHSLIGEHDIVIVSNDFNVECYNMLNIIT